MEAKVDNVLFEAEKPKEEKLENEGKILYCSKCGFKVKFDENQVALCPNCKTPLEVKKETKLRFLSGNLIGSRLLIKLRILGEGGLKTIPKVLRLSCRECGEEVEVNLTHSDWDEVFTRSFFQSRNVILKAVLSRLDVRGCKNKGGHRWDVDVKERLDYRFATVEELQDFEDIGERKSVVQGVPAVLLTREDVKTVEAECEVRESPTNELFLIIWDVKPIEEEASTALKDEEKNLIQSVFKGKSLNELKLLLDNLIAPDVNGREDAKLASVLTAVSPMWIRLNGREEPVPGCLRTLFYGDPRTGKGMILRWFWRKGLALHVYGEATSRTGLVWSIDSDLKVLRWGALPLADGRMAVIEGIHSLSEEEMEQLREVLVQQRIEVRRMVSGSAWVRTRIIADSNTASGRSLKDYLYKCQSIRDSKCFRNPVDITRWNLIIPFGAEDVNPEEMYRVRSGASEEQLKAFKALVRWAWSLKISDVDVSEDAYSRAVELYDDLKKRYEVAEIPIINNGTPLNLIRMAASYTILSFNLKNGKVKVGKNHVEELYQWFKSLLEHWELGEYKQFITGGEYSDENFESLKAEMDDTDFQILREIAKNPAPSDEIGGRIELSASTVRKRIGKLKELGLVIRSIKGYELTREGKCFLRIIVKLSPVKEGEVKLLGYYNEPAICEYCGRTVGKHNKVEVGGSIQIICDSCFEELNVKEGNR